MIVRGTKIGNGHIKYPVVKNAFSKYGIDVDDNSKNAQIVWYDGTIPFDFFYTILPYQRLNKIPNMDFICFKSNTFSALNSMRFSYPQLFNFFPLTFLLPYEYSEFQRAHMTQSKKLREPATWIVKPRNGCCGNGIKLIQNSYELSQKKESCIVQSYIRPYLVDGYKFDFRFYLCISTMEPFTAFIYKEGIARFCTKKYAPPTRKTLDDKYAHLTNTAVNVTNESAADYEFTQLASSVLTKICHSDPRGVKLWPKIKQAAALTLIAIYQTTITSIINSTLEKNTYLKLKLPNETTYEYPTISNPIKQYFHILGIDIMLRDRLEPIVLELNDRPSMHVTFPMEDTLKTQLIYDALSIITTDGSPPDISKVSQSWEQILPISESDPIFSQAQEVLEREKRNLAPQLSLIKKKGKLPPKRKNIYSKSASKLPPLKPSCQ